MKATITPETDVDSRYNSIVTIVDRVIDPASGTFGVRLELPNPDYQLPSGLKCSVKFLKYSQAVDRDGNNSKDENSQSKLLLTKSTQVYEDIE